jgi:hypothetical protein
MLGNANGSGIRRGAPLVKMMFVKKNRKNVEQSLDNSVKSNNRLDVHFVKDFDYRYPP